MSIHRGEVAEAPVRILSPSTRKHMACRLDSRKILLASQGIHRFSQPKNRYQSAITWNIKAVEKGNCHMIPHGKARDMWLYQLYINTVVCHALLWGIIGNFGDWRGVAEQAELDVGSISSGKISPTEHCLHLLGQKGSLMGQLWNYLEAMDRFDVIDDTRDMIYADYDKCMKEGGGALTALPPPMDQLVTDVAAYDDNILTVDDRKNLSLGLGLQQYTALVLFADEDIDFVQEMVEKLEGEYGLKLCLKDRDLIGGLQFESDSIVRLIIERCMRVIVILSPEFLASNANKFFVLFAHALSIDQRRRIVIPCLYKPCTKPPVISFCHSLDYYRAKGYWNYWEKLRDSLTYQPNVSSRIESGVRIRELSGSSTSSQMSSTSLNIVTTPSPSQSPSFFSKFLRRSDARGKAKNGSAALKDSSNQVGKDEADQLGSNEKDFIDTNGFLCSSAIPIQNIQQRPVLQLSTSSTSGESSDYTSVFEALPDVPTTSPCASPMSTTSSAALLLPDDSTSTSRPSRILEKIFKGRKKHKVYN